MSSSKFSYTSPIKKHKGAAPPEEDRLEIYIVVKSTGYLNNNFDDHTKKELRRIWPIFIAKDGSAIWGFLVLNKTQAENWSNLEPGQSYSMTGNFIHLLLSCVC